jgi:serine/threonine-protein kinase
MALPSGTRLDRYEVLSPLGKGGMGEVYLAQDTRLRRKVALKLLPVEFTQDADRVRRFEQEAYAASGLNHPNIITIYEIGQVEGSYFIATEFIEGQTLRQQMTSAKLALDWMLDVASQVASALSAAHAAGIVHRDIKPENVMVRPDGLVKVLDFGLAKLTEASSSSIDTEAPTSAGDNTEPGVVMGTLRYMSPEQARGQKVDARTDIFSLGVVLYEILAGQSPFAGTTTADVIAAILGQEPPPITRYLPEAPEALQRIITKSLRKNREERYTSAQEMLTELKELKRRLEIEAELKGDAASGGRVMTAKAPEGGTDEAGAARATSSAEYLVSKIKRHKKGAFLALAMVLIAALSMAYFAMRESAIDSIAVLPFVNEAKDPNTEYLSDGISDSIINRLSQLPGLRVTSLNSALRYKGKQIDAQSVGRELKVRAVLIGRMIQRGNDLSVSAELVDVRDNRRLWGEQYPNRQLADLLKVQEEIAREISEKLRLRLSGEDQQRLAKRETENSEAYQLYLQGRFYWNKYTAEGFNKSIEYFKQAVDKDPSYSLAYSGLADSYSLLGELSYAPPKEAFPQARDYAEKALKLDETLAEAHISLGIVRLFYERDLIGAEKALQRAKELNPNNPDVYHFYGHYLQLAGRLAEAIPETRRGVELDPTALIVNAELGWAYYLLRQPDQAIAQGRKTLELDPNFVFASWIIAQAYSQKGSYQEAINELNKARPLSADWSWIIAELGYACAASGQRAEAQKIIQELKERAAREYIDPVLIAYIYIALGEKDQAFDRLEKAYQERSGLTIFLKIEPKFDSLRGEARFAALLRRAGLAS